MNAQYTYDTNGKPVGVFFPIDDWEELIKEHPEIQQSIEAEISEIPEWQIQLGRKELLDINKNNLTDWEQSKQHLKL